VGFLFYFNLEYRGVAHAHELLYQDSEFNGTDVFEETAGKRASCINQKIRFRYTMKCFDVLQLLHYSFCGSSCKIEVEIQISAIPEAPYWKLLLKIFSNSEYTE
jgi:hypothetical protein